MTIQDVTAFFKSAFDLLMANSLLGIPLLVWIVITGMIGLIGVFIKGTKK